MRQIYMFQKENGESNIDNGTSVETKKIVKLI